jgi:Cu/Ag efflux protein CusF
MTTTILRPLALALAAALSMGIGSVAMAQSSHGEHAGHGGAASGSATAEMTEATVRKVDKAAAKVTLKHGAIKNLDMPPMTMVFGVKDKTMLDSLKAGDQVRFIAASESGQYVVTMIQVVQ